VGEAFGTNGRKEKRVRMSRTTDGNWHGRGWFGTYGNVIIDFRLLVSFDCEQILVAASVELVQ
jgi:hypothetical protein